MKTIFILALFFSLLLFVVIIPTKEGFDPNCEITNADSAKSKATTCQYATIYKTTQKTKYASSKLSELENLLVKAVKQNQTNSKEIDSVINNNKSLANAVDSDEEEGNEDPELCNKYPEAC